MPSKPYLPVAAVLLSLAFSLMGAGALHAVDADDDDAPPAPLPPPPMGHTMIPVKPEEMVFQHADPYTADRTWRLSLGYGFTSEKVDYDATATPTGPTAGGFGTTSHSSSPSANAGSFRISTGPLWGVHPSSRGNAWGWIGGVDLDFGFYSGETVNLPVTDADVASGTSRNGLMFSSKVTAQTYAIGPQFGFAYDLSPACSLEALAIGHVGIMHVSYTSGENLVFGNNPTPSVFSNSLYEPYYDIGLRANLAYRLPGGWEYVGTVGYVYGASMKGKVSDAVRFYQGVGTSAIGPQQGTFAEQVKVAVSGPYVAIGIGRAF